MMNVKQYSLFKTAKKTAKENNLIIAENNLAMWKFNRLHESGKPYIIRKKGVYKMTLQQQIEMAITYSNNTKKDIAKKMNVTPSAFVQRLKTGKFTKEELEEIASVLDAEYISFFRFKDGKEI